MALAMTADQIILSDHNTALMKPIYEICMQRGLNNTANADLDDIAAQLGDKFHIISKQLSDDSIRLIVTYGRSLIMHFKCQDLSDPEIPFDLPAEGQEAKLHITVSPSDGFEDQVTNLVQRLNWAALGLNDYRSVLRERERHEAFSILNTSNSPTFSY